MRAVLSLVLMIVFRTGCMAATGWMSHEVFDNSPSPGGYFHSLGSVTGPSALELSGGKCPVETRRVRTPPNALRLRWTSRTGGDWRLQLKVPAEYGRRFDFQGDHLSLWCYSEKGMAPGEGPLVALQDRTGAGTPTIPLVTGERRVPPGCWVRLEIPFKAFVSLFNWTEEARFDPGKLASVSFVQGLDDAKEHELIIDDVRVRDAVRDGVVVDWEPATGHSPMAGLVARGAERHVDLTWTEPPGAAGTAAVDHFVIQRARESGPFVPVGVQRPGVGRYADFVGTPGPLWRYRISAVDQWDRESGPLGIAEARTRVLDDESLLTMVQEACFRYYWEAAHPRAGMALEILPGDENLVAVGASGFGVMAMLVAAERGFVPREAIVERLLKILTFLESADRFHGAWPHFLDGRTGHVVPLFGPYDDGGDLVETAYLIQGLLAARQYFSGTAPGEQQVRERITRLWESVEWDWYRGAGDGTVLYWHWSPTHGWHIRHPLVGWNETMIPYLLAIASPTHPVPASVYHTGWAGVGDLQVSYRQGWGRTLDGDHYTNGHVYHGIRLGVGVGSGGELFFSQFSFLGFDPRGQRDAYADYFENNRALALINRAYCVANPRHRAGYGPDCWGISAGIHGGGKPLERDETGTITCHAAVGSMPYTPRESMAALKHFYRDHGSRIWGVYGFYDGFNLSENWFDPVYMGLNQAPMTVMIENHRSGLIWRVFMANPEISPMLRRIGFKSVAR